jgi:hypothetical protein
LEFVLAAPARADSELQGFRRLSTLASTITDNGDLNPYAVFVAPVSAGLIEKGDVIVDNFNNVSNLQGSRGTIVLVNPETRATRLFAKAPQNLPQCPGGVGLSTALAMLSSGWLIVGSTPSTDGATATKGPGCLLVFDANGKLVTAWSGAQINDPWGNMAVVDKDGNPIISENSRVGIARRATEGACAFCAVRIPMTTAPT